MKYPNNFGDFIGSNVFRDDDNRATTWAERDFLAALRGLIVQRLWRARGVKRKAE